MACTGALKDCDKLVGTLTTENDMQRVILDGQVAEISRLRASRDSLFRNPYMWMVVGFVAGGATVYLIRR